MKNIVMVCVLMVVSVLLGTAGLEDGVITEYSREQFLARLAETESVSLLAADERVSELERSAGPDGQYSYCEFKSVYDYGSGYTVEAGVLCLLYGEGENRTIVGVAGKWTQAAMDSDYEWAEAYHVVDWTPTELVQMVRGRVALSFETHSLGGTALRARLRRLGFDDGRVIGHEWYTAEMVSWQDAFCVDDDNNR